MSPKQSQVLQFRARKKGPQLVNNKLLIALSAQNFLILWYLYEILSFVNDLIKLDEFLTV